MWNIMFADFGVQEPNSADDWLCDYMDEGLFGKQSPRSVVHGGTGYGGVGGPVSPNRGS